MVDQSSVRKSAEDRLKRQAVFRRNLGFFAIIWIFCIAIWALTGAGFFWPVFVLFGTGIAAVAAGWSAYGPRNSGPSEQQIDAEMKKYDDGPPSS